MGCSMANGDIITAARLREILHRDLETGVFTWRITRSGKARTGGIAGCVNSAGYIQIRIDRRLYYAHRLAWLYMTGAWPKKAIDHINRDPSDNRWSNLRDLATKSLNGANTGLRTDNTSGFNGVTWAARSRKWNAQIRVNGYLIHLGYFDNPVHAAVAYRQAALKFHGKFAPVV